MLTLNQNTVMEMNNQMIRTDNLQMKGTIKGLNQIIRGAEATDLHQLGSMCLSASYRG